jgi:hypothetical protein
VLPIPFNEPGIATASNPIHGETSSYGFNPVPTLEPYKTYDGGNTGLRAPYLGLATNSTLYRAEGIAAYNALQFGIRKRLSKGLQVTGSYTWSHTLDMQSGLGLFYNGNDPSNLHSSYATSTYDRPHVITGQFYYQFPTVASEHGFLGHLASGWGLNGVTTLQSGFPFNAYDYSGAVGGLYYSHYVSVLDPVMPLKPGITVQQAQLQGTTGFDVNKPFIDPTAFYVPQIAAGTNGVPAGDTVETVFGATGRNTFRGPFQFRADVALVKLTRISDRFGLRFQADLFNVFNHPSFDTPSASGSQYYIASSSTNIPAIQALSTSFGRVTSTIGSPRFIQLSLSLNF